MSKNSGFRCAWWPMLICFSWASVCFAAVDRPLEQPVGVTCPNTPMVAPKREPPATWSMALPLKSTVSIQSYHLVDGNLYALGSDGQARCIRADNGEYLWTAPVGEPELKIWAPVAFHASDYEGVGFAGAKDMVFLDAKTGLQTKHFPLSFSPSGGAAAAYDGIYVIGVSRSLTRYDIKDGWPRWHVAGQAVLTLPPLYLWGDDLVIAADDHGRIIAIDSERQQIYLTHVEGSPRGWLAADATTIYVATTDNCMLHALDRHTGKPLREPYRLVGPPQGGPVVTAQSVYQATATGGLHRIGLSGDGPNWYHTNAKMFLAEWPEGTVVLTGDGRVVLVDGRTGSIASVLNSEGYTDGVSNPFNDVVIVGTDRGQIRCYRPNNAPPLDLKTFHPTTQPASTQPAVARKAAPPAEPATIMTGPRSAAARSAASNAPKQPAQATAPPKQPPTGIIGAPNNARQSIQKTLPNRRRY